MELTGICKDAFDKWFELEYSSTYFWNYWYSDDNFPFSMAYGVYVDFFDSVGIYLGSEPLYDMSGTVRITINEPNSLHGIQCSTRQKARTEAIKKANEIFNND